MALIHHSVMLRVISYNERAIKCYEACGFKPAGRRREARIDGGKFHDVLFMDLLSHEFGSGEVKAARSE
jgi:RimJ/RimL family protein N-acetyltransferase